MNREQILYKEFQRLMNITPTDVVGELKLYRLRKKLLWEIKTLNRFKLYNFSNQRN